jgi:hypothetical protein
MCLRHVVVIEADIAAGACTGGKAGCACGYTTGGNAAPKSDDYELSTVYASVNRLVSTSPLVEK